MIGDLEPVQYAAPQVAVGEEFAAGAEVAQDLKLASECYLKAAEQGNTAGEIHLAELYRDGRGVARDKTQAAKWYRKAAEQGDASAQGTLAMLYVMGQGVPRSDLDAYYWFDLAAAGENAQSGSVHDISAKASARALQSKSSRTSRSGWLSGRPPIRAERLRSDQL